MKSVFAVTASFMFLVFGFIKTAEIKKSYYCLEEICRFIIFIKEEIRYKSSSVLMLREQFINQKYRFVFWNDEKIGISKLCDGNINALFDDFCIKLGTSDVTGQIALCEQYGELFAKMKTEKEKTIPSKSKIYLAFSLLLSLCTLVVL